MKDLGIEVHLNAEVTPDALEREAPDALVVAAGGEPLVPRVAGIEKAAVADDVLLGRKAIGQTVVVISRLGFRREPGPVRRRGRVLL